MANLHAEKTITADDFIGRDLLVYTSKSCLIDNILSKKDIETLIEEYRNKGFDEYGIYHAVIDNLYDSITEDELETFDLVLDVSFEKFK